MKLKPIVDSSLTSNIKDFFRQIIELSRNKINVDDNLDGQVVSVEVSATETRVGHNLGRIPKYILPLMCYPNGIPATLDFVKPSTETEIFIKSNVSKKYTLLIM